MRKLWENSCASKTSSKMRILVTCFFADPLDVSRLVGEAIRKLREAMPACRWGCDPIVFSTSTAAILKPCGITMRKSFSQFSRDPRHNVSVKGAPVIILVWEYYEKTMRKLWENSCVSKTSSKMRILVSCFLADPLVVTRLVGEGTRKLREAMPTCRWGCDPIVFCTSTAAIAS